jgi:hypothetical protein
MHAFLENKKGYTCLQNVPAEVLPILDFEDDAFAFVRDRRARLDFVVSVSASVAVRGHDQDILGRLSSLFPLRE